MSFVLANMTLSFFVPVKKKNHPCNVQTIRFLSLPPVLVLKKNTNVTNGGPSDSVTMN